MNRRHFLHSSLLAAAFAPLARAGAVTSNRAAKGFKVGTSASRYAEELQIMGGRFDCKVSAKDTGGDLCIYDTLRSDKGGPALHRHYHQDEWFYVVRGEFIVRVGDDTMTLAAGDSAFAPRQIPHAFAKISDGEGHVLILFQPAGNMEDFFLKMARLGKDGPKSQDATMKQLWLDHGMEILGPPLTF